MAEAGKEVIALLKAFREITLALKEKLEKGEIEEISSFLSRRQEIIEKLDKRGPIEEKQALPLLFEINDLDQEVQRNLSRLLEKERRGVKNMQENLNALRHFRSNLQSPSPPRFLDQKR
ncbi:MAG: hypothetical protein PWP04_367 [Candidatus Atribacteria bacterium]|nr:hypothetical protein [Candidatus Atribacteria bacterium]